jgi:Tol biopolymer transport system component
VTATRIRALLVLATLSAAIVGISSPARGSFPGENGVLAFDAVDDTTSTVQIFQVSSGGTGLKQLTTTMGAVWNEDPVFSANGQTIYFDSMNRATTGPSRIYRMNADGTGRQLADAASPPTHVWPSVNRSGSALAVVQYLKGGQSVIATMRPNGTRRKVVAKATRLQSNGSPEYAPSGSRIAYARVTFNRSGQGIAKADLFVRNGTRNTNITSRSSAKFFGASWAPDGRKLVAIRGQRTIVSMRPNGTGLRVLTTVSGARTGVVDAVYSPDGTKIAYLQCAGDCGDPDLRGQGSIWVMNADGSGKQRVFNGGNGVQPASRLSWGVG